MYVGGGVDGVYGVYGVNGGERYRGQLVCKGEGIQDGIQGRLCWGEVSRGALCRNKYPGALCAGGGGEGVGMKEGCAFDSNRLTASACILVAASA